MLTNQSLGKSALLSRAHLVLLIPKKVAYVDKYTVLELCKEHVHCPIEKNAIAARNNKGALIDSCQVELLGDILIVRQVVDSFTAFVDVWLKVEEDIEVDQKRNEPKSAAIAVENVSSVLSVAPQNSHEAQDKGHMTD